MLIDTVAPTPPTVQEIPLGASKRRPTRGSVRSKKGADVDRETQPQEEDAGRKGHPCFPLNEPGDHGLFDPSPNKVVKGLPPGGR